MKEHISERNQPHKASQIYETSRMYEMTNILAESQPEAQASLKGSSKYPNLNGTVLFYPFWMGSLVFIYVSGLPYSNDRCSGKICAFHIHAGHRCSGTKENPFADAGMHYNPLDCPHPEHAGDLPPLFSNNGTAMQMVYTDRFTPDQVIGLTAIIHLHPDDFTTQPSGNAGEMIGCGEISKYS